MDAKTVSKEKGQNYDDLMKSFRSHFSKENIQAEKTSNVLKGDYSDISLKALGDKLKKEKPEGK